MKRRRLDGADDGAGALEGGIGEVDGAAGIAEVGVAAVLEEPALGLLQVVGKTAHLGGEGRAGAAHLADAAGAHQHALGRVLPVDAPDLDGGIVEQAGGEVVLVEAVGAQRALDLQVVDGEADRVLDLGGGEAGGGGEGGGVEGEVAIVVGEAQHACRRARVSAPAPGERGGAGVEVGLEGGRGGVSWERRRRRSVSGETCSGRVAAGLSVSHS